MPFFPKVGVRKFYTKQSQGGRKYDGMYDTLCRAYSGPDGPRKEWEYSKPYKAVIIDNYGTRFILYHYHNKGEK